MKIGLLAEPPDPLLRLKRRVVACTTAVLLLSATAAGWSLWRDVKTWKDSPQAARRILTSSNRLPSEVTDAVVILHRDVARSIDLLRSTASAGGPAAEQAKIALQDLARKAGN